MPKAASYDQLKEFKGKKYSGMKVGRKHHWKYDAGDWIEKKVTPDRWEISYSVVKRRAGKAPDGTGAPVGTAYRWYILANQVVTKLDANSYTTEMVGVKYKVAHKRADKETWSASENAQKKALAKILREMLAELEAPPAAAATEGDGAAIPLPVKKPRATRHSRPVPQARKRGSTRHHPRIRAAPPSSRAARRPASR
ncbi:MAG TPA: hypothetical protein VM261_10560 [Kofleriaceae bacterium]|nr:hypothetical protein [Kofleriaceae bacterium]